VTKRRNTNTCLIRKQARSVRVGETLLIDHIGHRRLAPNFRGPFVVREVKHHTERTVTFILSFLDGRHAGGVETLRDEIVTRISGPPISCVIQEEP
jgi:hypothetical protein